MFIHSISPLRLTNRPQLGDNASSLQNTPRARENARAKNEPLSCTCVNCMLPLPMKNTDTFTTMNSIPRDQHTIGCNVHYVANGAMKGMETRNPHTTLAGSKTSKNEVEC